MSLSTKRHQHNTEAARSSSSPETATGSNRKQPSVLFVFRKALLFHTAVRLEITEWPYGDCLCQRCCHVLSQETSLVGLDVFSPGPTVFAAGPKYSVQLCDATLYH